MTAEKYTCPETVEKSVIGKMQKIIYRISYPLAIISAAVLAVMTLLTVADVTLRYVLNRPITASIEITELMMAVLVFLSIAYSAIKKRNVTVDFVASRFPRRASLVTESITGFLAIIFFSLVSWQSIVRANFLWKSGDIGILTNIPSFPFLYLLAFGTGLLCLVLLTELLVNIIELFKK